MRRLCRWPKRKKVREDLAVNDNASNAADEKSERRGTNEHLRPHIFFPRVVHEMVKSRVEIDEEAAALARKLGAYKDVWVFVEQTEGQPAKVQTARSQKQFGGRETILVVDDEDAVRQTAKSALQSYGYRVVLAQNGEEGVNLFREFRDEISVVLLDMTMPVMSGEEAFMRIKHIREDIRVVLSSGYDETEATRRFTGKGLAGFVQKPYTAADLAAKMKRALDVT